jgi:hypothetical protein
MSKKYRAPDNTGRAQKGEQFARLFLATMQTPAWRALSPHAQRLYPWVLLEWKGARNNKNGRIKLSVQQAAKLLGSHFETARRAFHDLQAKGFLAVITPAVLGTEGKARAHAYEITELGRVGGPNDKPIPRKLYLNWRPGHDFPVVRGKCNNPSGKGGFTNLESQPTEQGRNTLPQPTASSTPNLRHPDKNP